MSDPITALSGIRSDGRVTVAEMPRRGMITLRGALDALAPVASDLVRADMPDRGRCTGAGERLLAWMSPDELMLMLPADEVAEALDRIAADLAGVHHMAAEVTDARALFRLEGGDAALRETLGKVMPVDFSESAFAAGMFRRSRMAQIPAAVWRQDDGSFAVMCFRSVAAYAFEVLRLSADRDGAVGHY